MAGRHATESWVQSLLAALGLGGLADVDTSGADSGDALVYDGTDWGPGEAGVSQQYVDDAVDNATDRVWVGAPALAAIGGSPSLAAAAVRWAAWHFDQDVNETVAGVWGMPASWASVNVDLYWSHQSGSASGDVFWRCQLDNAAEAGSLAVTGPNAGVTDTAAGQFEVVVTRIHTDQALTAANMVNLRVTRVADDSADTLSTDAALLGVMISKAS